MDSEIEMYDYCGNQTEYIENCRVVYLPRVIPGSPRDNMEKFRRRLTEAGMATAGLDMKPGVSISSWRILLRGTWVQLYEEEISTLSRAYLLHQMQLD